MTTRKTKGAAPTLTDEIRKQLAQSLTPIRKDEVQIYRGTERRPLIAIETPSYGRVLAKACELIQTCCKERNLETDKPGALRIHKTSLAGYLVAEPVLHFDKFTPDLYELSWLSGRTAATINLLPILQPRNMEVPQGYVTELPVSLENLDGDAYLIIHLDAAETRSIQEMDEAQKAAMARTRQVRKQRINKPQEPPTAVNE